MPLGGIGRLQVAITPVYKGGATGLATGRGVATTSGPLGIIKGPSLLGSGTPVATPSDGLTTDTATLGTTGSLTGAGYACTPTLTTAGVLITGIGLF